MLIESALPYKNMDKIPESGLVTREDIIGLTFQVYNQ